MALTFALPHPLFFLSFAPWTLFWTVQSEEIPFLKNIFILSFLFTLSNYTSFCLHQNILLSSVSPPPPLYLYASTSLPAPSVFHLITWPKSKQILYMEQEWGMCINICIKSSLATAAVAWWFSVAPCLTPTPPPRKQNIICWHMAKPPIQPQLDEFPREPPPLMNFKVLISLCYRPYVAGMRSVTETHSAQEKHTNGPTHWRHKQLMCNVELVRMPWWIVIVARAVSNRQWKGCWLLPQVALVKQKEISVSLYPFVLAALFFFFSELSASPVMLNGVYASAGAAAGHQCYYYYKETEEAHM